MLTKELLFDYLKEHSEVKKRMVAAYVLGYSVTREEIEANHHLKFTENANDTGVIISYNTESPNMFGNNTVWLPGSLLAINPISWTRTEAIASVNDSLGSYVPIDNSWQKVEHLADAQVNIERGVVLWLTVDKKEFSSPNRAIFPIGALHEQDIGFYYYNLQENAKNRIKHYLNKNNKRKPKYMVSFLIKNLLRRYPYYKTIQKHLSWFCSTGNK